MKAALVAALLLFGVLGGGLVAATMGASQNGGTTGGGMGGGMESCQRLVRWHDGRHGPRPEAGRHGQHACPCCDPDGDGT